MTTLPEYLLAASGKPVAGPTFLRSWANGTFSQLAALARVLALVFATVVGLAMSRSRNRVDGPGVPGA